MPSGAVRSVSALRLVLWRQKIVSSSSELLVVTLALKTHTLTLPGDISNKPTRTLRGDISNKHIHSRYVVTLAINRHARYVMTLSLNIRTHTHKHALLKHSSTVRKRSLLLFFSCLKLTLESLFRSHVPCKCFSGGKRQKLCYRLWVHSDAFFCPYIRTHTHTHTHTHNLPCVEKLWLPTIGTGMLTPCLLLPTCTNLPRSPREANCRFIGRKISVILQQWKLLLALYEPATGYYPTSSPYSHIFIIKPTLILSYIQSKSSHLYY
jgi:hypothetical protein